MTKYYLIWDRQLGKEEDGKYYLYENSKWVEDRYSVIRDHLIGYDPYEDFDSPYKIGSTDVMREMKEISEEEARKFIGNE